LHNILSGIELHTFLTRVSNFYCGKFTVIGKGFTSMSQSANDQFKLLTLGKNTYILCCGP